MEQLILIAQSYGPFGLIIFAQGAFIVWHMKRCDAAHEKAAEDITEERDEWRRVVASQHTEAMEVMKQNAEALEKNSNAITEISTLIRDRN